MPVHPIPTITFAKLNQDTLKNYEFNSAMFCQTATKIIYLIDLNGNFIVDKDNCEIVAAINTADIHDYQEVDTVIYARLMLKTINLMNYLEP
jgi:hypothetical protein